ncbi:uncharacterized protein LOC129755139 isoform X2 [Uranotaenia lowii]|uniref:uncharacterized protein LOC129755139 isoform X2 n=1 Tax=Uranotaenia lowii TaxID=190385 RepID=UPI0024798324|nr:uncharacterized protein LOC129755139 isoform X2 [Uranotaenia lowii]
MKELEEGRIERVFSPLTKILSEFIVSKVGYHPSTEHKQIVARSLVNKYPVLSSNNQNNPAAFWFNKNGNGQGKHTGKLQWHLGYLVKKHNKRKQTPRKTVLQIDTDLNSSEEELNLSISSQKLDEIVSKLKFMSPIAESRTIIEQDWQLTYTIRTEIKKQAVGGEKIEKMFNTFPLITAYHGHLVSLDFDRLFPHAKPFAEIWSQLEDRILEKFHYLFTEIPHIGGSLLKNLSGTTVFDVYSWARTRGHRLRRQQTCQLSYITSPITTQFHQSVSHN